jgi:hypothetical protein
LIAVGIVVKRAAGKTRGTSCAALMFVYLIKNCCPINHSIFQFFINIAACWSFRRPDSVSHSKEREIIG